MPDPYEMDSDGEMKRMLGRGLATIAVPAPSPEFNSRVLAAVSTPRRRLLPDRNALWRSLRPILGGAACSAALTVGLYFWGAGTPLPESRGFAPATASIADVERALDSGQLSLSGLHTGSLSIEVVAPDIPAEAPLPPGSRSQAPVAAPVRRYA